MQNKKRTIFIYCFLLHLLGATTFQAQSLYMPAATNWVGVGDLDVAGNQLTVEALIYYTGASVDIVSKHTNPADVNYLLRIGSFEITTTSGFAAFSGAAAAGVSLVANRMYHVAATYDGAFLRYYVNGCLTGSMAWTGNMVTNNLTTAIGNMSTCQCEQFVGYIDEVRIWNVARTQAQISANMINLPSPATQPGLLGYWKFDGSYTNLQGNAAFDGVPMGAPQFQQIPLPYPSLLSTTTTSSNPVCTGDGNGTINIASSGYYLPHEYSLDGLTYGSSSAFSSLNAGTYYVYTRPQNNNSCVTIDTVVLIDPPAFNPNLATTNVTCNGAANGTASVAPSGGDGPVYHQVFMPMMSTSTSVSSLAPGNYSVTVSDSCRSAGPDLVSNGQFENGNTGFTTGYSCCAGGPGNYAVDVDPSFYNGGHLGNGFGGNGNYLIVDGSTVPGTSAWCQTITVTPNSYYNFSAWAASNYTGATAVLEFDINGVSIGTVNAPAATNTWVPFQGSWFSGAATSASICIIDQNTIGGGNDFGIDNISFRQCLSCISTIPFTITEPPALTISETHTNITCNGAGNGTATVAAAGGTGTYTYSWNTVPAQSTATATSLLPGTYTATVTDANGCTASVTVTITEPPVLAISQSSLTDVSCNGASNGNIGTSTTGGTGAYTYSWNTAPVQTSSTATNLPGGNYTVTVTDANACSATLSATIAEPAVLSVTLASQVNVACNGQNTGSATVAVAGGTAAYSIAWNSAPPQTTMTASALTAGTYTAVCTDAHGCTDSTIATITEPAGMSVSIASQANVSCNGGNNGSATISAAGGAGGYTYSWNTTPVQNSATAGSLNAGNYIGIVTDANGCPDSVGISITEPPAVVLTLSSSSNVSCNGGNNGSITVTASGGTGAFSYSWAPNVSGTNAATGLSAGTYTITATDANACAQNLSVTLTEPAALSAASVATPSSICPFDSLLLSGSASGGTNPYSFSWSNGATGSAQMVQPSASITYTLTVTDSAGCTALDSSAVTVFPYNPVNLGNDTAICDGNSVVLDAGPGYSVYTWQDGTNTQTDSASSAGTYIVTATDANGCTESDSLVLLINPLPLPGLQDTVKACPSAAATIAAVPGYASYSWSTGSSASSITTANPGYVFVTVTDINGCTSKDTSLVWNYPVPSLSFVITPANGCAPLHPEIQNTSVMNGATVSNWTWQIGSISYTGVAPSMTLTNAGSYDVFLQATTSNGCVVDSLTPGYINVYPQPVAGIYTPQNTYELFDTVMYLYNASVLADTYTWLYNGSAVSNQNNITFPVSDTGAYNFELLVTNVFGCRDSAYTTIYVNPSYAIYFPNAFTPNSNGRNDVFMPKGYGIHEFEMTIFNRWGEQIYVSNDLYTGWDGTYKEKEAPQDVYVYRCRIKDSKRNEHYFTGKVTLVR